MEIVTEANTMCVFPPDNPDENAGFNEIEYIFDKIMENAMKNLDETSFSSFFPRDTRELYLRYGSSANDPFNPTGEAFKDTNHGKIINVNDGKIFYDPLNSRDNKIEILLNPDVSNSLVVTYTPVITTDESGELKFEKDDEMGNFVITSGEPFVIRSDMYFQGNLTISLKSISKELSDSGQAGFDICRW